MVMVYREFFNKLKVIFKGAFKVIFLGCFQSNSRVNTGKARGYRHNTI